MPSSPRSARREAAAIAVVVHTLLAAPALAQPSSSDDAFLQGKALMQQGRVAEACQKFEESQALEPRGGTLLNLAVCREKEGRYATALRLLHEARERAVKDGRSERVALADERIQSVMGLVSWLTVRVAAGADTPDLVVKCDGEELPREGWGKLRAVDPGPHTVTAVTAAGPRFQATVQIGAARDTQVVEIPATNGAGAAEEPEARPMHVQAVPPARPIDTPLPAIPPPPRDPRSAPVGWRTPVGGVALGLGAVALATGTGFGIRAIVDVHESEPDCPKGKCMKRTAYDESQDAHTAARVADVTLAAGLAFAAVGLYLILGRHPSGASAPQGTAGAPRLGVTFAAGPVVSLGGAF